MSVVADVLRQPKAFWRELGFMIRGDCAGYCDLLGDDVLEGQDEAFADSGKPLWLNLGYWKEARTYPAAGAAMARLLAEAAAPGEGDIVLDVGFGFSEQDLFWVENYRVARIIGFSVTPLHVDVARQRVEQRGLAERIHLGLGTAVDLPLDAGPCQPPDNRTTTQP